MKYFTGTWSLMGFIFKRDKISLLCWVLILPLLPLMSAISIAKLYNTKAALEFIVASVDAVPLEITMYGHMLAPTIGAVMSWKWLLQSALFLGIFNLFFVIKHTRNEEASGRYELLSSTSIGRYAILTATLGVAFIANFLIGASITAYLYAYQMPFIGSFVLGLSACLIGFFMASLSALVAQLTQEAGSARGIMGISLVVFYILNMLGNSVAPWLLWVSPISWTYKMRPYADENGYISWLFLGSSLIIIAGSYFFLSQRDIGVGFLKFKEKVHKTSPLLNNSFALAWRLHRKMIFWWSLSFALMGALCGAIMNTVTIQVGDNEQFKAFLTKMGGLNVSDMMFTLMIMFFAQAFAAYTIMATGKLQVEELENRSDIVFALALGRIRWALNHLGIVLLGIITICFAFGASAGFFYGLSNDNIVVEILRLLGASYAFLPALCVISAFSFLIFAISPKHFYLSWLLFVLIISLDFIRELVPNSDMIAKLSPFTYVPKVLIETIQWQNIIGLALVSLLLLGIGLFAYRKRDLV